MIFSLNSVTKEYALYQSPLKTEDSELQNRIKKIAQEIATSLIAAPPKRGSRYRMLLFFEVFNPKTNRQSYLLRTYASHRQVDHAELCRDLFDHFYVLHCAIKESGQYRNLHLRHVVLDQHYDRVRNETEKLSMMELIRKFADAKSSFKVFL